MKKPVIYIHIGIGKTGTTSLQAFFNHNRTNFAAMGLLYPKTGRTNALAHHEAVWQLGCDPSLLEIKPNPGLWPALLDEINQSGAEKVLLSSECFYAHYFQDSEIQALRHILKDYQVRIIALLRRQDNHLISWYKEAFKRPDIRNWPRSMETFFQLRQDINYYDYHTNLLGWSRVFGKENLIIRLYEANTNANHIEAFCKILLPDFNKQGFREIPSGNLSLSDRTVRLLYNSSRLVKQMPACCQYPLGKLLQLLVLNRFSQWIIKRIPNVILKKSLMSGAEKEHVLKKYRHVNQHLFETFFEGTKEKDHQSTYGYFVDDRGNAETTGRQPINK